MMVSVDSLVKEYVDKSDTKATRVTLTTIGYFGDTDSFENFKSSTEYAKEKLVDLFEEDDGLYYDEYETIDNYKNIISLMMNNFSEKKYDSAVKIGSTVFVDNAKELPQDRNEKEQDVKGNHSLSGKANKRPIKVIIIILIVIAIIVCVLSLIKMSTTNKSYVEKEELNHTGVDNE